MMRTDNIYEAKRGVNARHHHQGTEVQVSSDRAGISRRPHDTGVRRGPARSFDTGG
jgi:hypothetical protein